MRKTIQANIEYLVEHREELSKNKFSGVHFLPDFEGGAAYRVHKGSFIPRALDVNRDINTNIALVVGRTEFECDVKWDSQSLWLTIAE